MLQGMAPHITNGKVINISPPSFYIKATQTRLEKKNAAEKNKIKISHSLGVWHSSSISMGDDCTASFSTFLFKLKVRNALWSTLL